MKKTTKSIVFTAAVAALAALLLAGCQERNNPSTKFGSRDELPLTPSQRGNGEQTDCFVPRNDGQTDSLKEDSMKAFFERMRRWDALHGGMRQRESDK